MNLQMSAIDKIIFGGEKSSSIKAAGKRATPDVANIEKSASSSFDNVSDRRILSLWIRQT